MSDGLISEVTALLGARLAIRAADQAHFGGKQVYTSVKASTSSGSGSGDNTKVLAEVTALRQDVTGLKGELAAIKSLLEKLTLGGAAPAAPAAAAKAAAPAPAAAEKEDEDFDLFGSDDSDDEEKKAIVEARLKEYHAKKAKKAGPIAKSSVILDVKPWDDETNMEELEANCRSIEMDGLVWGGGKLLPIGYGIKKLQIITVIEDDKVSVDDLIEKITEGFPDHVQSVDIHAFNKI